MIDMSPSQWGLRELPLVGKISFVDCDDIASSAVAALTLPSGSELLNKPYDLTGADALTYGDVAKRISQLVGYEVLENDFAANVSRVNWTFLCSDVRFPNLSCLTRHGNSPRACGPPKTCNVNVSRYESMAMWRNGYRSLWDMMSLKMTL